MQYFLSEKMPIWPKYQIEKIENMKASQQIVQLDVLRGMAALIVVVSHSANVGLLPSILGQGFGQMGVGIFYILSAFLLTILYSHRSFSTREVYDYLIRRWARVLPLFYAAVVAAVTLEIATGISVYGAFETTKILAGNVLLIQGSSVLWSIPVEVQFYVIFLGFWRLMPFGLPLAFSFLLAVQAIFLILAIEFEVSSYSLPYWMHFFTIGCVFGVVSSRPDLSARIAGSIWFKVLAVFTLMGTLVALPGVRRTYLSIEPWQNYVDPVSVGWGVIVSAAFIFGLVRKDWVNRKIFLFMGEVSFSAYLLHMVFIIAVINMFETDIMIPYDRFLIVIISTYVVAGFVTKIYERPVQKFILRMLLPLRSKSD